VKKLQYLLFFFLFAAAAFADNHEKGKSPTRMISGRITDTHGESIPGAIINIAETGEMCVSDFDGRFTVTIKVEETVTMQISSIGFQVLEIRSSKLSSFSDLSLPEIQ
jgi:hypothetical protein